MAKSLNIDLSDNLIQSLTSIPIENSKRRLVSLNLTRNNISRIDSHTSIQEPWHAFVIELILIENNVLYIESGALAQFSMLRRLDIDHNFISTIHLDSITHVKSSP